VVLQRKKYVGKVQRCNTDRSVDNLNYCVRKNYFSIVCIRRCKNILTNGQIITSELQYLLFYTQQTQTLLHLEMWSSLPSSCTTIATGSVMQNIKYTYHTNNNLVPGITWFIVFHFRNIRIPAEFLWKYFDTFIHQSVFAWKLEKFQRHRQEI